jgi:reactive intermediate/imine deaminase
MEGQEEGRPVKRAVSLCGVVLLIAGLAAADRRPVMKHINPPALPRPNGYSHVVEVGEGRTVYVSGQIAVDQTGAVVGSGDFKAQARQVFENLKVALAAAGADFEHVVKITVFLTDVGQLGSFREVRDAYFAKDPPASSLIEVARLVRPELMIEVEAIAVVESGK